MFGSGCFCRLHIGDIRRAFDNIFSNLWKYADPNYPINITTMDKQGKSMLQLRTARGSVQQISPAIRLA